ncbi:MAG: hypothetical protein NTW19_17305 [Planctomycetota bacterium]|nr:hypothetical protein [Planctomycetota bacterium]
MAFDLYVGTLTRFYRREWENVVQQRSKRDGLKYQMIYAGGPPKPPPPAAELQQIIAGWTQMLTNGLAREGLGPVTWSEDETQPYFTDRPGWQGHSALLTWAAHAVHPELPLPSHVPESWADDDAYTLCVAEGSQFAYQAILKPEIWLPVELPGILKAPTLASDSAFIGSTFELARELKDLKVRTGDLLRERREVAARQAPKAHKEPGLIDRLLGRRKPEPTPEPPDLATVAEHSIELYSRLASLACEHRLPMLPHF